MLAAISNSAFPYGEVGSIGSVRAGSAERSRGSGRRAPGAAGPATGELRNLSLPPSLEWAKLRATTGKSGVSARAFGQYVGGDRQMNGRHDHRAWET